MGYFIYDNSTKIQVEDRLLVHIQIVMGSKLRRSESFFFSWKDDASLGGGRITVWVHPGAGLKFKFHGSRQPTINQAWLGALSALANSPRGLHVVPEPRDEHADRVPVLAEVG